MKNFEIKYFSLFFVKSKPICIFVVQNEFIKSYNGTIQIKGLNYLK